jgi:SHS2 domain-containing protein
MSNRPGGFEILEHTADVGIRAVAGTAEGVFEQATFGLLDITGALRSGSGTEIRIDVEANDIGALLVYWLEEVLYLQDARDSIIMAVDVGSVTGGRATGTVTIAPREEELEGTAVKAITYHQLKVEETSDGWVAVVFFDI